jgi:hypothetical protein
MIQTTFILAVPSFLFMATLPITASALVTTCAAAGILSASITVAGYLDAYLVPEDAEFSKSVASAGRIAMETSFAIAVTPIAVTLPRMATLVPPMVAVLSYTDAYLFPDSASFARSIGDASVDSATFFWCCGITEYYLPQRLIFKWPLTVLLRMTVGSLLARTFQSLGENLNNFSLPTIYSSFATGGKYAVKTFGRMVFPH